MLVVVSYDVPDNRRRGKIARTLQDFGGERVATFGVRVLSDHAQLGRGCRSGWGKIIETDEDSVRLYRLCDSCRGNVQFLGLARPIEEPGLRYHLNGFQRSPHRCLFPGNNVRTGVFGRPPGRQGDRCSNGRVH